jgi:hypothetical protein
MSAHLHALAALPTGEVLLFPFDRWCHIFEKCAALVKVFFFYIKCKTWLAGGEELKQK